ncbi:MAG: DNA polymerase III subunit delta [Thermoleophilia bacterium]|nr:DNA polymerase III subunit delta [Thermoleophilia bacterium]MDQ3858813.1 DNA polymerase III subunit delta [Actinomycetota bacterium]
MASDPLRPVYLLTGSDRPKVRRALARLRGRFPPEAVELFSADTATGADAVAGCNALGLFGDDGARLVVVEGVERWRADDAEAVVEYLRDPVGGAVLALVADAALRQPQLVAAVEGAGHVLRFDVPKPRDPSVWVRGEFERVGVRADAEAARALVEIVGDDVVELAAEVEKIATWAGDEAIGRREVELLATGTGETFVWTLTDAWGSRDVARVLGVCESLLERRAREPFSIAVALASYVGRVRAAQALEQEGASAGEVAKRLRIKEYPARKALQHAKSFSRDELDLIVVRLAELDAALKGASRLAAELELERALVGVTAERAPAAAG